VAASADVPGWWNSPELVFVCGADTDGALAIGLRLLSIGRGAGTRVTVCVDKYGEELSEVFQDLTGGPAGLLSIYGTRQALTGLGLVVAVAVFAATAVMGISHPPTAKMTVVASPARIGVVFELIGTLAPPSKSSSAPGIALPETHGHHATTKLNV
jgi:hypothetical protein